MHVFRMRRLCRELENMHWKTDLSEILIFRWKSGRLQPVADADAGARRNRPGSNCRRKRGSSGGIWLGGGSRVGAAAEFAGQSPSACRCGGRRCGVQQRQPLCCNGGRRQCATDRDRSRGGHRCRARANICRIGPGEKLANRTFQIPAYLAEPMLLGKEELVPSPAPVPETPPLPPEAPPVEAPPAETTET